MSCCGKKRIHNFRLSPEQKKVVEKVRKANYGAVKRGNMRVTLNTKQCLNCNTLVSNKQICPICGHPL